MPVPNNAAGNAPVTFGQTSWTVVFQAARGGDAAAQEAWEVLARGYWRPLLEFCKRQGDSPHDAEDHVQGYFAKLLQGDRLKAADRERGLFRNWLMAGIQQHRREQHRRAHAGKRRPDGGFVAEDIRELEERDLRVPAEQPDHVFLQEWTRELVARAREVVRQKYAGRGLGQRFELLWPHLLPGEGGDHAALARTLKLKPASLSDALSNFRREFHDALRRVVREGLEEDGDVEAEIRELLGAFA